MRRLLMLGFLLTLTGCTFQGPAMRLDSPFGMSDEEFNQRVAALVNPPLKQLQAKHEELAKKVSTDEKTTP